MKILSKFAVIWIWVLAFFSPGFSQSVVPATAPVPGVVKPVADEIYRLGPGDRVDVRVYPDDSFSIETRIADDGSVILPLVGEMKWGGRTLIEAREMLRKALDGTYYKNPRVILQVTDFRNSQVSILGAVIDPKAMTLYGVSDVLNVLGEAGGLDERSSGRLILVRGGTAFRSEDVEVLDARALLERGDLSQNRKIMPGDTLFAPRSEQIYIFGQVLKPGSYQFVQGMTLLRAIALAGGLSETARGGSVEVMRRGASGSKKQRTEYDVDDILKAKAEDPELQPDDVVVVPESFF